MVGENFCRLAVSVEGVVRVETEEADAHEVDVRVGVVTGAVVVAVEVAAVGTLHQNRFCDFFELIYSHSSVHYRHLFGIGTFAAEIVDSLVHCHAQRIGVFLSVVDTPQSVACRHQFVAGASLFHPILVSPHSTVTYCAVRSPGKVLYNQGRQSKC